METMLLSERKTCGVFITSNFSYIDKSFPIEMRRYEKLSEKNRNSNFFEINDGVLSLYILLKKYTCNVHRKYDTSTQLF